MLNDVWVYNGVKFCKGNNVRVVRFEEDFAPDGMGEGAKWENVWIDPVTGEDYLSTDSMNFAIGKEYEIADIDETGVYFVNDDAHHNPFGYPLSALLNLSAIQKEAA